MSALPWQSFSAAEPDVEYLAMASRLRLRSLATVPNFFRLAGGIRKQLATADGLVGYSLFTGFTPG